MAEKSTARSAEGTDEHHYDSANPLDSWISRQLRLSAGDPDPRQQWQGTATPPWREDVPDQYEEPYRPEDIHQRHGGHRTPQRHEDAHEQYDGAHDQYEHPYRRSSRPVYPEPGYHEPDRPYREEHRTQEPSGPTDAGQIHGDAYAAAPERYVQPAADHAYAEYPDDVHAGRNDYPEVSDLRGPEVDEARQPRNRHQEIDTHPGSGRRRFWLIPISGLALGALLWALAFTWGSDPAPEGALPVAAPTTPGAVDEPATVAETPSTPSSPTARRSSSTTPSTTPSVTPTAAPSATPTPTVAPTPSQTENSGPVLLGPSGKSGLTNMVQRYCDRYTGGSADPRDDGRWQCRRLLSASTVDMNVACRLTYGSGAYAQTSKAGDPYAWRCYR